MEEVKRMKFSRTTFIMLSIFLLFAGCSKDKGQSIAQLMENSIESIKAGNFDSAEKTALQALTLANGEKNTGADSPEAIKPLQVLGMIYQAKKDFPKAVEYYQRAIKLNLSVNGENSIEAAQLLNNLAGTYYTLRQYANAIGAYKQSLAIAESLKDKESVTKIQNNINVCESSLSGNNQKQALPRQTDDLPLPDLVPAEVKNVTLEKLAQQNIKLTNLRPLLPIKIGNEGMVFPYRCSQKLNNGGDSAEMVLLFSAKKTPEKQNSYTFSKCRMVPYESYSEELGKNDPESLIKTMKEVFPGVFS